MRTSGYLSGPHHFWTHFWCGLVVGIGLGAWSGSELFDGGWKFFSYDRSRRVSPGIFVWQVGRSVLAVAH